MRGVPPAIISTNMVGSSMKYPLLAPLAVVLLSGCGGAASVRQAAMAIADAPSLIAALIAYYSAGQNPLPNEFDDAVRECVDDLDNGSDAEEMFGEERLPCLCYDRIVDQVSRNVPGYIPPRV